MMVIMEEDAVLHGKPEGAKCCVPVPPVDAVMVCLLVLLFPKRCPLGGWGMTMTMTTQTQDVVAVVPPFFDLEQ